MGFWDSSDSADVKEKSEDKSSESGGLSSWLSESYDSMKSAVTTVEKAASSAVSHLDTALGDLYGKEDVATKSSTVPKEEVVAKAPVEDKDLGTGRGGAAPSDTHTTSAPADKAAAEIHTEASIGSWISEKWHNFWDDKPAEAPKPVEDHKVSPEALTAPGSEYKGSGVKADPAVAASDVDVWTGDDGKPMSMDDVVNLQMPDASPEDRAKYKEEIKKVNKLTSDDLKEGQHLELPGHNEKGDLIMKEKDGGTRTVSQDGTVKIEHKDGTGLEYKPIKDGGYTEHHFGPKPEDNHDVTKKPDGQGGYKETHTGKRPEDNYEITRTADGKYLVADKAGDNPVDKTAYDAAHPDPRVEKARLSDQADAKIKDPMDRLKFHEDMDNFEKRAEQQKLSPEQQAKFYHEVDRLLEAKDNPNNPDLPKEGDRAKIAEQIMAHAADPKSIDQGNHGTCAAAALENAMFNKDPADAARMITDVATTGEFKTTDGRTVKPDASLIKPDKEAQENPVKDGDRSYASQLFQGTAITIEKGDYKQVTPTSPSDTGERADGGEFHGLRPEQIADMNKAIAGDRNPLPIIENGTENADINKRDSQIHVNSEKELGDKLKELKEGGKLPAVMFVDTNNEPFWTDSRAGLAGGSGGGHFVTVTDFDPKTGKVTVDNQWGARTDHSDINIRALYIATEQGAPSEQSVKDLKAAVDANKKEGKFDPTMELALARQEHKLGKMNDQQYEEEMKKIMVNAEKKWATQQKAGSLDQDEQSRTHWAMYQMEKELPQAARDRIQNHIQKNKPKR